MPSILIETKQNQMLWNWVVSLIIGLPIQLLASWDIFTCGFSPEGTYSRNPSMHNFGCSTNLSLQVSYQEVQCIQYGYVMDTEPKFSQYLKYSSKKVLHVFKISNVPFSTQKRFRKIFVRKCLWLFNNLQKQNDVSFSCQAIRANFERRMVYNAKNLTVCKYVLPGW